MISPKVLSLLHTMTDTIFQAFSFTAIPSSGGAGVEITPLYLRCASWLLCNVSYADNKKLKLERTPVLVRCWLAGRHQKNNRKAKHS